MSTSFLRGTSVSITDDFASNGGSLKAKIPDWADLSWEESIASSQSAQGRGRMTLLVPIDSPCVSHLTIYNVIRIDHSAGDGTITTFEYRITELDDSASVNTSPNGLASVIQVIGAPFIEDAGRFQMRSVSGGVPSKVVSFNFLSPSDILSDVVIPAMTAGGMTGITLGTVDPTGTFSVSQRDQTPLSVISWLEQQTQAECWLERTSEAAWTLNLGTQGSGAAVPKAIVERNVIALDRTILVDDNFATRIEPEGSVAASETEPTHMGGATWDVTGVSSRVVTIDDPDADQPVILEDGQLDGLEALVANEPLYVEASGPVLAPVFDTTRRYLWWIEGAETLKGRDVASTTSVSLDLAQSGTVLAMAYDSSVDRLVIAYSNLAKVLLVNPATPAITNTITTPSNPLSLSVVSALSRAYVGIASAVMSVINTSAATIAAWTSGPVTDAFKVLYHAASTRLVVYVAGATAFSVWASPAGAVVASSVTVGQTFIVADDPSQTTMGVVASAALKWGTITVSGTPSFSGFTTMPAATGITLSPGDVLSAGGRYYIVDNSGKYIIGWNGSAYTGVAGDVGLTTLYALERGPTTSETSNLFTFDMVNTSGNLTIVSIRRLALTVDCSAFEHWTVSSSDATAQTVTMPASGSGGPVRLASDARLQFRASSSLDYLTRLDSPSAVTLYGDIDASPAVTVLAKTNYWRGGRFDEWRADRTNTYCTASLTTVEQQFTFADRNAVVGATCTMTADSTTTATTLSVGGLAAGAVVSVGDIFTVNNPASVAFASGLPYWQCRKRTTASASGIATVPVNNYNIVTVTATAIYRTQAAPTAVGGRTDCLVVIPNTVRVATIRSTVPLPYLTGDAVAWAVAHVQIACYNTKPSDVIFGITPPYSNSVTTVSPADTAAVSTGELRSYWLAQRIDLSGPGHGFVRLAITTPTTGAVYVQSLAVMLAAASTADAAIDLFGADGANALWRTANLRLLAGNMPSVQYKCEVIEDDPAKPFTIGATVQLRDPSRAISASPRLIHITRKGSRPNEFLKQPVIELSTTPISLLRSIAQLQTDVAALMASSAGTA